MQGPGTFANPGGFCLLILKTIALRSENGWAIAIVALITRQGMSVILSGVIVSAIGFVACWIPPRRAARIEPMVALRQD